MLFVVCKLLVRAFRRAATMEALVNSIIKLDHFPVRDTYSKVMNSHALDWTNLKINVSGNKSSRSGTSNVSFHKVNGGKVSRCPTHSSSNTKMFYSHISSKPIKSELCKAINSFSLQEAVAGVSGEEILFTVKENSNKKAIWNKE